MLENLRIVNSAIGPMTPSQLEELTPKELNYMVAGASERSINQVSDQITANQVTSPVVMVEDNASDDEIINHIKERRQGLTRLTNPEEHEDHQKQNQLFMSMFLSKQKGGRP